ncbi:MAG: two-CW domain-containing protein [Nitrospirota bacterium]
MAKVNCWEFRKCGMERGGKNAGFLGACPAATGNGTNGINGGQGNGRSCWLEKGTLCDLIIEGTYASKEKVCSSCTFYKLVEQEEGKSFVGYSQRNVDSDKSSISF